MGGPCAPSSRRPYTEQYATPSALRPARAPRQLTAPPPFPPSFCRPYAEKYAADQAAFFSDYATSHAKLSELGVDWVPGAPVAL